MLTWEVTLRRAIFRGPSTSKLQVSSPLLDLEWLHSADGFVPEGDDSAYGQALFPVPAEDPNDPLQASFTDKSIDPALTLTWVVVDNPKDVDSRRLLVVFVSQ